MSFADILCTAAAEILSHDKTHRLPNGEPGHEYSCNAVQFANNGRHTAETVACKNWYYQTILCADREIFHAGAISLGTSDPQNIRFMLLMFASYLAADEGL